MFKYLEKFVWLQNSDFCSFLHFWQKEPYMTKFEYYKKSAIVENTLWVHFFYPRRDCQTQSNTNSIISHLFFTELFIELNLDHQIPKTNLYIEIIVLLSHYPYFNYSLWEFTFCTKPHKYFINQFRLFLFQELYYNVQIAFQHFA